MKSDLRKLADQVSDKMIAQAVEDERKRKKGQIPTGATIDDFLAYLPQHLYIYRKTGQLWPAASLNGHLPWIGGIKPAAWLDTHDAVEQMTWAPGQPALIEHKLIADGGWLDSPGSRVFNLYRPPHFKPGNPRNAQIWFDHVGKVYPDDADHIVKWLAYRCQHPAIKINHALVLGGAQGIGKDTLLEPVRYTVGYWNCAAVAPTQLLSRFNGFLKSILLVVSEARDLGEINRPNFYEHTKTMIAAPPDAILIDEKNTHPYYIPNLTGLVITTNHKATGIYLPPDDRRHYVAWSPLEAADFDDGYWIAVWNYYERGGLDDVRAYLMELDVSEFNPKAPPPHTAAFDEIVTTGSSIEAAVLDNVLRMMGYPDAVTLDRIRLGPAGGIPEFVELLGDKGARRLWPRWFETCDYVVVRNPNAKNGLWMIGGKKQMAYAKKDLRAVERIKAVESLN